MHKKLLFTVHIRIVVLQLMEDGENGASGLHVQLHVEMAPKTGIDTATILHQTMEG